MGKKILIVEKNLIKAMSLEKVFIKLGATSIGIATDYFTSMVLIKDSTPDIVFVNPNLTLESEGLDVAHEISQIISCKFYFFKSKMVKELSYKNLLSVPFQLVDETSMSELGSTLSG